MASVRNGAVVSTDPEQDESETAADIPTQVLGEVYDYHGKCVSIHELRHDSSMAHPLEAYLGDHEHFWKGCATFTAPSQIESAGLGLYTILKFQPGDKICVYSGTPLRTKEAIRRKDKSYLMRLGPQMYVDPLKHPSVLARYINDPRNSALHNVAFDKQQDSRCAIVEATRTILPGEELFVSYGRLYWVKDSGESLTTAGKLPSEALPL
eukprot:gb/GECG01015039.1/.p1 GENE.gb/GECG01015039.1/~~gb/GECG01015039.1/.p1  ORF type:complete len:209 (+),score=19.80 gb/GECG01015039.1/:1-627(+)